MKILALGGCGQEGKIAVNDMIISEQVKPVVLTLCVSSTRWPNGIWSRNRVK
jgi:hypothetical protein